MMNALQESPAEALARIQSRRSENDVLCMMRFADAGVPLDQVEPRVNVLTYRAWRAKDRQVAKGATSISVPVWVTREEEDKDGKRRVKRFPRTAHLFHVSQTIPAGAPKGTRPEAWANANLVKPGTYEGGAA